MFTVGGNLAFLLVFVTVCNGDPRVPKAFKDAEIVPDIIDHPPLHFLKVTYSGGLEVDLGNEITPTQTKLQPDVSYRALAAAHYTLLMIDPDAPSRENITMRSFEHWLVVNIPGKDVGKGEVKTQYIGSGAGQGSGFHRYTFLLFKQPSRLEFEEAKISDHDGSSRPFFNVRAFIKRHGLGSPLAGNFLRAQWDESVPALMEQLFGN